MKHEPLTALKRIIPSVAFGMTTVRKSAKAWQLIVTAQFISEGELFKIANCSNLSGPVSLEKIGYVLPGMLEELLWDLPDPIRITKALRYLEKRMLIL